MKYFYITLVLFLLIMDKSNAQQITALDWTKTDCIGKSHHLFDLLNKGYLVITEYVMLDCQPCITAANSIEKMKISLDKLYRNKILYYTVGYNDKYSCTELLKWKSENNVSSTVLTNGFNEVSYYGGMGMPTFVILKGKDHRVIYTKKGVLNIKTIEKIIHNSMNSKTKEIIKK